MDNVYAWRLGEACDRAAAAKSGDLIDRGWALRNELEKAGFKIVPHDDRLLSPLHKDKPL